MSFLSDSQIKQASKEYGLVMPCEDRLIEEDLDGNGILSYGPDSYGYSVRVGNRFKVLNPPKEYGVIDPKNFNDELMTEIVITTRNYFLLPPRSSALCESVETFNFPRNISGYIAIKSTYARCFLLISAAAIEPGWGSENKDTKLTIEITNPTPFPIRIYIGEGIVQVQFQVNEDECEVSYRDRKGKYNSYGDLVAIVRK